MNNRKVKLFCIPHAGGSALKYYKWKKYLSNSVELYPVELSGRGKRFVAPLYNSFEEATEDICEIVKTELDGTMYAVFGHSMGSLLAYELINKLKEQNFYAPIHVFFSGRHPPHVKVENAIHFMNDIDFIAEIIKYDGIPQGLLNNKEILDFFIPILRADYRIIENYRYYFKNYKFEFDISVFSGNKDRSIKIESLEDWGKYTKKRCIIYEFQGGHFFLDENVEGIIKIINDTLLED